MVNYYHGAIRNCIGMKNLVDGTLLRPGLMTFLALMTVLLMVREAKANPDAKRLYDDLLSNYNRLIRPVSNHTEKVTVKLGLRLSQLVDLVSDFLIVMVQTAPNGVEHHFSSIERTGACLLNSELKHPIFGFDRTNEH